MSTLCCRWRQSRSRSRSCPDDEEEEEEAERRDALSNDLYSHLISLNFLFFHLVLSEFVSASDEEEEEEAERRDTLSNDLSCYSF